MPTSDDDRPTIDAPDAEARPEVARTMRAPAPPGNVLAPGDLLDGRYRVVALLARGGMGEVYHADDTELREGVAIKVLRPEIADDERAIKRFKREIHLSRKVTHRNVCRIFDVGYHESPSGGRLAFLTMELLLGETLAALVARAGRVPPERALPIARQMAEALAAAHRAGIIHRDFKSPNVIVCAPDPGDDVPRVVVTDFGIARGRLGDSFAGSLTAPSAMLGTPDYMAPEQVEGGEITPAADIYAFGVVLFELITGELPFRAKSRAATALQRLGMPPPSPKKRVPEVPEAWDAAIRKCLALDPAERFASALDAIRALE